MRTSHYAIILATAIASTASAKAQENLIPWDQTWEFMHPMGTLPDVPAGGDSDFDTTWYLPETEFAVQYDGPAFGSVPKLVGDPLLTDSYDSGVSQGPLGYSGISYFDSAGAEFTEFGDDDGDPGNGLAGELSTPESGERRAGYFRTTFNVPADGGALVRPVIRALIDDGAYIYLDGELVAAVNMPTTDPPNRDTYATVNAANATQTEALLRTIDLSLPAGSETGLAPADPTLEENSRVVKQLTGLSPGQHTLAVSVRSNSQTSSDIVLAIELSAEEGCFIAAASSNVVRSDAGTPFNANDDTFTFDVTVDGVGGGGSWSSPVPGGANGVYGAPVTLGPFPIAQSPITVSCTAASDPLCTADVTASAPEGSLTATVASYTRDLRGTLNPNDDTFTAQVLVESQFASLSWATTGTTPITASPGTPGSRFYGITTNFGPYSVSDAPVTVGVVDSIDANLNASIVFGPPVFIGGKSFGGTPTNLLSSGPLPTQWENNGTTPPTLTIDSAGGNVWREFRSEVIDLSTNGAVGFSAELVVRETSTGSNYEGDDAFRAQLLLTGAGVPASIDLIAPFDRNSDGLIDGTDSDPYDPVLDEFNTQLEPESIPLNNVLALSALIPAGADSAQLVVEAKAISGSEALDVRQIAFNDGCSFELDVTDVVRNSNGQPTNVAVHTVELVLNATSTGLVSPLGWDLAFTRNGSAVAGASVTGGAYNTDITVSGLPAEGGPITITATDRIDPACTVSAFLAIPSAPIAVALVNLGGADFPLYSEGAATGWTAVAGGLEMEGAPATTTFSTEFVDLSGTDNTVYFSMDLQATEASANSNFEDTDTFLAELVMDDGMTVIVLNLVTENDTDDNGVMNGDGSPPGDEFNPGGEPEADSLDNTFTFSGVIPGSFSQAALRITAQVDAPTETFRISNALFTTTPPDGSGDSDGDGVSDDDEAIAGTDPFDANSVFRVIGIGSADPADVEVAFPTVAGRFYQGYLSTDLVTWTRDDSSATITGDGSPASWEFAPVPAPGEPQRYLKMAVAIDAGGFPATLP